MKIGLRGSPHQQGHAFTLAEVMIAVVIIGITFVALYAGLYFAFNVTRFERENLRATQIMMERSEALRLLTMAQVTNTTVNPRDFYERYYPGAAGVGAANGIIYTGHVDIAQANMGASTYATQVLKITISVKWSSGNIPRARSVSTYVAQNGLQNYVYDKN
jgi:prepilin-type N-terminal cleavage/methylation domain-containing protein